MTSSEPGMLLSARRGLVTGGTRGLGAGIATAMAEAGAQVVASARHPSEEDMADGILFEPYDVGGGDPADIVDRAEARLGGVLDIVVHSAGTQARAPALELAGDDWDRVISVNLTGGFRLSQEIARRQVARGGGGRHIFIASLASRIGLPNVVAYNAAKSGLLGVVRGLATELAPHQITVNAIGPGYIHTKLTSAVFADPVRRSEMLARIPMERFGEPDDIAGPAVFLASDAARYVTGQLLMVDGGWTAA